MPSLGSLLIVVLVTISAPPAAEASAILIDASGLLKGAIGVIVAGNVYDVEFVEGTCALAYGVCDEAHFAFTTEASALQAAKALIDQVFLDVPAGEFDSDPMLTRGCNFPDNCWALTPYKIMGSNFLITQSLNNPFGGDPDGYFVHQPAGPGLVIADYDASTDINGVLAKWTLIGPVQAPVADPASTILLLISSTAGLALFRRLGRRDLNENRNRTDRPREGAAFALTRPLS